MLDWDGLSLANMVCQQRQCSVQNSCRGRGVQLVILVRTVRLPKPAISNVRYSHKLQRCTNLGTNLSPIGSRYGSIRLLCQDHNRFPMLSKLGQLLGFSRLYSSSLCRSDRCLWRQQPVHENKHILCAMCHNRSARSTHAASLRQKARERDKMIPSSWISAHWSPEQRGGLPRGHGLAFSPLVAPVPAYKQYVNPAHLDHLFRGERLLTCCNFSRESVSYSPNDAVALTPPSVSLLQLHVSTKYQGKYLRSDCGSAQATPSRALYSPRD